MRILKRLASPKVSPCPIAPAQATLPPPPLGVGAKVIPLLADLYEQTPPDNEAALMAFLDWSAARDLPLYDHQEQAILELAADRHVVLSTPTGSGKSLVALALHFMALVRGERSVYTSPIKALVNEKFLALCKELGAHRVGLMTGDGTVNPDATVLCCTAEVLAQMALTRGDNADVQHVVMDEFHYYADRDRGMAWQLPLLTLKNTRFLLMSATLGDTTAIQADLQKRTGRPVATVTSDQRPVPLHYSYSEIPLQETVEDLCKSDRAPLYVVFGSQREAAEQAQSLTSLVLVSKDQKKQITEALQDVVFPSPFGKTLQRLLRMGIGLHHAGLLPRYRLLVEQLAQKGLLRVLCGTDTLGVGVNIPLRTVVLTRLCKYDGEQTRLYSVREFQQLAGRAGRKGYDTQGWVVGQAPEHVIQNRRMEAKLGRDGKMIKFQRAKPPERGYVPWTAETFAKLEIGRPEALQSVFRVDPGLLVSLCKQPGGVRKLAELIGQSHDSPRQRMQHRRDFARQFRALRQAKILTVQPKAEGRGSEVVAAEHLQHDFGLHHALSLWLVHALDALRQQHTEDAMLPEAFAWDAVSLVESVLEQPMAILIRQQAAERTRVIADLKSQGVPFDERVALLEEVTWPKPLAQWIYSNWNSYCLVQPWLPDDAVRPKSIARDMAERWCTFDEYVRDLDLEPIEGLLLRYLSQTYKALVQNVPDDLKDEGLLGVVGYLRAVLHRVDDSLVQEWEKLGGDGSIHAQIQSELPPRPPAPGLEVKARTARLRARTLELLQALCAQDQAGVAELLDDVEVATFHVKLLEWQQDNGALVWSSKLRGSDSVVVRKVTETMLEFAQTVQGQHQDGTLVATYDGERLLTLELQ